MVHIREETEDGIEKNFATNTLGNVRLLQNIITPKDLINQ